MSKKTAPPPIPLRSDLGEGANENTVPKIPPPTLPKNPSFKKKQGRPEISIISSQPISGAFVPFVPDSSQSQSLVNQPETSEPNNSSICGKPSDVFNQQETDKTTVEAEFPVDTNPSASNAASFPKPFQPNPPISNAPPVHSSHTSTSASILATDILSPVVATKPPPPIPASVPPKSVKTSKPRAPPQRPKTKPVCEPSLTNDPFQVAFQSIECPEKQPEPLAPKRTKNNPNKTLQEAVHFGINNSAFQEVEVSQQDDILILDEAYQVNKGSEVPTKKSKQFPSVIRTKPNGKENPNSAASSSYQDDLVQLEGNQVKFTKPVAVTQARKPPPPPPSKAQDSHSETLTQQTKSKPTIIIPKVKKDDTKPKEKLQSTQPTLEAENKSNTEEKTTKAKKMPLIIRPNKQKKEKSDEQSTARGTPEGQSHESTQAKSKIVPVRKAPPRPSPPKPGPSRPGPPKKKTNEKNAAPIRTQPPGNVAADTSYTEKKTKDRPATIGKEKGTDKKDTQTVVSSVVETKIEPSCIALYDYHAANFDDLSFQAGDEIFLVERVNQDWYIGRIDGSEGMIPIKFVEIIEDIPQEPVQKTKVSSSPLDALVLYDFAGQSQDELTIHAGETVHLLGMLNDDWLKGSCNGMTGIFPTNFVNFTPEMKHELLEQKPNIDQDKKIILSSGPRCKALYDYHTGSSDDLTFNKNDIIKLTERINDEWVLGEINGQCGIFPVSYVEIIEDLDSKPSTGTNELSGPSSTSNTSYQAKALHDFISDTVGDLSFREGDKITVTNKISDEWFEGEFNGEKGIFPAAYVESLMEDTPGDNLQPKAKALYDFTGETGHELSFKSGDEILLLRSINSDWMEGQLGDDIGQFPTAFVDILVPLP